MAGKKAALLIGIRTYPNIPKKFGSDLDGCHNDVETMHEVLAARGFNDLRVLVDRFSEGCACAFCRGELDAGEPTRKGILAAVRQLTEEAGEGDVAALYYSGHGSEISGRDLFAGQRFQTLVPHDSGRGDAPNRDILDREVELWIRRLNEKTPAVTMIFDCCHSGGLSELRGGPTAGPGRQVKADERPAAEMFAGGRPDAELERAVEGLGEVAEGAGGYGGSEPARAPSGWVWRPGRSAVVLSGCAARELSSETVVDGRKQGLFTRHLSAALLRPAAADKRWGEIFPEAAAAVARENLDQHPRREGDGEIFTPGEIDAGDVFPPDVIELKKLAAVIGIDYQRDDGSQGFPALRTPRRDAEEVARVLAEVQGYEIVGLSRREPGPLLGARATRRNIHKLLQRLARVKARSRRETAVVIYFAGHGVVRTLEDGSYAGYLVPWEAERDTPSTWLPMKDLRDHLVEGIRDARRLELLGQKKPLSRLTSRHLLLVLDCCFGGAASFEFFRGGGVPERPIYYSEYKRFVEGPAWQLLTSASYNQQALDRDPSDPGKPSSPFAGALIEALTTEGADAFRQGGRADHIVTATELHGFIDARLRAMGVDIQTPGLMPLRPIRGQFIFRVPGFRPSPVPDPVLDPSANPWRGSEPHGHSNGDAALFFGRERATLGLLRHFLARSEEPKRPPLAVVGVSGSGKTSLVRAGLLPLLQNPAAAQRRVLAWLGKLGLEHLVVAAEDLGQVRGWAQEHGFDAWLHDAGQLAERIGAWAAERGLAASRPSDGGDAQARARLKKLGIVPTDETEEEPWLERLALLELLSVPQELADRLELLLEKGLLDFLCAPPQELAGWIGGWRILDHHPAPGAEPGDARTIVVARSHKDVPAGSALFEIPLPSREELRQVIDGPAADRVLFFHPAELIDELVEEAAGTHLPLAWLSLTLNRLYAAAWERRGNADRQINRDDHRAVGGVWGLAARRAEDLFRELCDADPAAEPVVRRLFLRTVAVAEDAADEDAPGEDRPHGVERAATGRQVSLRELELAGSEEQRSLHRTVLPRYIAARLLVTDGHHIELASNALLDRWHRLRGWVREADAPPGAGLAVLRSTWRRSREWEESDRDRGKLWDHDPVIRHLVGSPELNCLEHEFVAASDTSRLNKLARRLVHESERGMEGGWSRAALVAAEAAKVALASGGEAVPEAEQRLRDMLAQTPLAVSFLVGAAIRGLAFADRGRGLRVHLDDGPLTLDLGALDRRPRRGRSAAPPPDRTVRVQGDRGLAAEADPDRSVRLFPSPYQDVPEGLRPFLKAPLALLGHSEVPGFLALANVRSRRGEPEPGEWLASAAHLGGGARTEIRLWRLRDGTPSSLPAEPAELVASRPHPALPLPGALRLPPPPLPLGAAAFLAGGWLAAESPGGEPFLWDLESPGAPPLRPESRGRGAAPTLLAGGAGGWLTVRDADTLRASDLGGPPLELPLPSGDWRLCALRREPRRAIAWNPDDGRVAVWDFEQAAAPTPLLAPAPWQAVAAPVLSGDGSRFALPVRHEDGGVGLLLRDAERPAAPLAELRLPEPAAEVHLSADGKRLATLSRRGLAQLFSLPEGELLWSSDQAPPRVEQPGQRRGPHRPPDAERRHETITHLAFFHRGQLALVTTKGHFSVLEAPDRQCFGPPAGLPGQITAFSPSPDGKRLAVGDASGLVRLWLRRGGDTAAEPPPLWLPVTLEHGHAEGLAVGSLAFDREGRRLAVVRHSRTSPHRSHLDLYRMDVEELMELARGHAGRPLRRRDLPPEVWYELFGDQPEPAAPPAGGRARPRRRPGGPGPPPGGPGGEHREPPPPSRSYLEALGLPERPRRRPPEL